LRLARPIKELDNFLADIASRDAGWRYSATLSRHARRMLAARSQKKAGSQKARRSADDRSARASATLAEMLVFTVEHGG
jgi:hypothetical protein